MPEGYKKTIIINCSGQEFPSVQDACIATGISISRILAAIRDKRKAGGFFWTHHRIGSDNKAAKLKEEREKKGAMFNIKRAVINCDGDVFDGITDAAKAFGVSHPAVSLAIRTGGRSAGKYWAYHWNGRPNKAKAKKDSKKVRVKNSDLKEFESIESAAEFYKVDKKLIHRAIKNETRCHGMRWYRCD